MKRLIIRADDLGISEAVTAGCLSAAEYGVVTCMGMIVNMEASPSAARLIKGYPDICLGLHLNLIVGTPCAEGKELKGLTDENGRFICSRIRREQVAAGEDPFIYEEVYEEAEAQVKRFMELNGKLPEYMDSHSVSTPVMTRAVLKVAEKYGIRYVPISGNQNVCWKRVGNRPVQYEFYKTGLPFSKYLDEDTMQIEDGEIGLFVLHPGFLDQKILDISGMTFERLKDHEFLVDSEVKRRLEELGIKPISFRDLNCES
ncbi:ChbG/HpnK family deacetylase [Lacrimispora sp.]|uniref:ChbG/HpnK family deacetylase n=1 Tax=Lacrimispora sp. TaxID=2719234 RepID=UPI0034609E08